jgi:hypothetical protein
VYGRLSVLDHSKHRDSTVRNEGVLACTSFSSGAGVIMSTQHEVLMTASLNETPN